MARTKKTSPAEDLLALIAMLPWWAGVALAVFSYGVLHSLATPIAAPTMQPGQIGEYVGQMIGKTLAYYGQFIVPVICLVGAALSAWRRRQRRTLVATVTQSPAASVLDGLSWREFEQLVGEGFRLQGYQVIESGGSGPDGGVDLVLNKGGDTFLVQCKQWKAYKVGVEVVRELYGVMAAKGAAGGFVVTSGQFTGPAREFVLGRNLELLDGPVLLRLLHQAQAAGHANAAMLTVPASSIGSERYSAIPACPACNKPMVCRTAKRGEQAGTAFWGCAGFPACRGTRAIG